MGIEDFQEELDKLKSRSLTDKEVEDIRALLEQDRRAKWLWASVRTWILAVSALIALFTVGLDGVKSILKRLVS